MPDGSAWRRNPVTLELWWAGHRIQEISLDLEEVFEKLKELETQVKQGVTTFVSCGTSFVVEDLCVDIRYAGEVAPLTSFKRKT